MDNIDTVKDNKKKNNNSSESYNVEDPNIEYKMTINDDNDYENLKIKSIDQEAKIKKKLPFIIYIFIFSAILFLTTLIVLIYVLCTYKIYYEYKENIYLKPIISEHNYSSLLFDNGLKIILTQVHPNDYAGGALAFEAGYLDSKYKPGFLNLAVNSLRYNDLDSIRYLNEYMGSLNQSLEEFYTSTYFTIINSGFKSFLNNFKNYTQFTPNENRGEYISRRLNRLSISSLLYNINEREKHLIEYLVYNITDNEGKDVWRQGIGEEIKKMINDNFTEIINIMEEIFNPKKIKLIFYSQYKMSLMRKYILRYLQNITKLEVPDRGDDKDNGFKNLITNKIIYHQIGNNENNYIKINYYINNEKANFNELYIDSGYFNYLKYILDETHNESLYYKLTHPEIEGGLNIKSLSCNIGLELKRYIRFTILIKLNEYSYSNIEKIIEIVYNYMEKIKAYINNITPNDIRAEELKYILDQNFSFSEDVHSGEYYKNKAKDLFYRDIYDYFLKEVWVQNDFNNNFTKFKNYIKKLKMENSIVIVGINQETLEKYNINNTIIFCDIKNTTIYSNISYSIHDLSDLSIQINNYTNITGFNHSNEYISKYNKNNTIQQGEVKKYDDYIYLEPKNYSDHLVEFYYLKETSFCLPKVYVNLYFFHPFIRPNYTEQTKEADNFYFHIMIYIAYLQREINLVLSDAIRAGNTFKLGLSENFFYLDIFAYSDQIEKILKIIKEKIIEKKENLINETNFAIFRDYAIEDLLNFGSSDLNNILRIKYYKFLTEQNKEEFPPIYNYYNFPRNKFRNITINETKYLSFLNAPIIRGFILGFYEREDAQKICDFFRSKIPDNFNLTLHEAKFDYEKTNPKKFLNLTLFKPDNNIKKIDNNITEITNGRTYSFICFDKFTYENRVFSEILVKIALNRNFRLEAFSQKKIYIRFSFTKNILNNTLEMFNNLIEFIDNDKNNYTQELDVIGDKYYYLKKNMEEVYSKTPEAMRESAMHYSYDILYNIPENEKGFSPYKIDEYKDFNKEIKNIINQDKCYYELSND